MTEREQLLEEARTLNPGEVYEVHYLEGVRGCSFFAPLKSFVQAWRYRMGTEVEPNYRGKYVAIVHDDGVYLIQAG